MVWTDPKKINWCFVEPLCFPKHFQRNNLTWSCNPRPTGKSGADDLAKRKQAQPRTWAYPLMCQRRGVLAAAGSEHHHCDLFSSAIRRDFANRTRPPFTLRGSMPVMGHSVEWVGAAFSYTPDWLMRVLQNTWWLRGYLQIRSSYGWRMAPESF